ncbi:MAG: hypothetical protein ABW019_09625 [Chitinophagaceae bacterium]
MPRLFFYKLLFLLLLAGLGPLAASAQYRIRGTVYDSSRHYPLELVSVMTSSGRGTLTNADGQYVIEVAEKDSIWFSYLNKPTVKFPVLKILNPLGFDIALQVSVPELREVRVQPRNYRQDSIQNREDYASIFNYRRPGVRAVTPQYGAAAGFDLDELINVFRFKRNRSLLAFQQRLLVQEQEKFIDHRFSKALVRRLTGLDSTDLEYFMQVYRPPYFFTLGTGDYDFQKYIKDSYERYKKGLPPELLLPEEETEP